MTPAASRANAAAGSEPRSACRRVQFSVSVTSDREMFISPRASDWRTGVPPRQRLENRNPRDSDWRTGRSRSRAPMKQEGTSPAPAQKLRSCVPASSAITTRQPRGSNRGTIGGRSAPWSWSRTANRRAPHPAVRSHAKPCTVQAWRSAGAAALEICNGRVLPRSYGENTWQPSAHWQARRVVRKIKQIPEVAQRSRVGAHSLPPKS